MKFVSPITWVGGKSKHFNKIKYFLPKNIQTFIEPFCGGASVGLNVMKEKLANFVCFNDLNEELINFWNNINNIDIEKIKKLAYPNSKTIEELNNFYLIQQNNYWFHNQDYKNIINIFCNDEKAVWYLDPPYFYNKGKPYKHAKMDFQEFKQFILKIKGKWILSIDNSPEIKELFKEFNICEFEWVYTSSNSHKNKPKIGKELIITNFQPKLL